MSTESAGRPVHGPVPLHVVLFQPRIPPNTGNVGRLCAVTGCRLHLVHPLGFRITDRHLKRSGMDYWRELDVHHHDDWPAFRAVSAPAAPRRRWLFSTHAVRSLWEVEFAPEDGLVFGNETDGAPPWLHEDFGDAARVRIPQFNARLRSLNLSTSVGIATYEALRQLRALGALPGEMVVRPGDAPGSHDESAIKEL
jgi:tRNA (cytidine/uridine-2'-O-)-methyltransferase